MQHKKKIFARIINRSIGAFIAMFFAVVGVFSIGANTAHAAALNGDVQGYAWSGVGWISLNCAQGAADGTSICPTYSYKVTVTDDVFSGYAWSDGAGWISFNPIDIAECYADDSTVPSTPGTYNESTGAITGWARALSGSTGGWDGCISLGNTSGSYGLSYSGTGTPPTVGGTVLTGYPLTGYAWGDESIGWVDFDYASVGTSTLLTTTGSVTLLLNPSTDGLGPRGGFIYMPSSAAPAQLTWTSTGDVASCSASSAVTGTGGGAITDWGVSIITGLPSNSTSPVSIMVPFHPTGVADAYSINCITSTGTPVPPDTVVVVPTTSTTSCGVTTAPSSMALTGTGTFGPVSDSVGVNWSGSFTPTSFTVDPPGGGITVSPLSGSISTLGGTLGLSISGTMPTSSVPITIHGLGSDGTICSDGTITLVPPSGTTGTTGTGGTTGPHTIHFPYKEL